MPDDKDSSCSGIDEGDEEGDDEADVVADVVADQDRDSDHSTHEDKKEDSLDNFFDASEGVIISDCLSLHATSESSQSGSGERTELEDDPVVPVIPSSSAVESLCLLSDAHIHTTATLSVGNCSAR